MLTLFAPLPQRPPRTKEVKLAEIYDADLHPLWGERFARMLARAYAPRPRGQVLEIGCRTGALTEVLLRGSDAESRVIAVDPLQPLVDRARARLLPDGSARPGGARLFLRNQEIGGRLPFADGTYDVIVANLTVQEAPDWAAILPDLARLVRPGGSLHVALALRGTWGELIDLFDEALLRLERNDGHEALRAYVEAQPTAEAVAGALEAAGLHGVESELGSWELLFKSAREFFYAPLIEHGPLPKWKEIAGRGPSLHEVFFDVKETIDTYFAGRAFGVSVVAGCFSARKPEAARDVEEAPPAASAEPDEDEINLDDEDLDRTPAPFVS